MSNKKHPVRKKFTIIHSNDIHGDFQAEIVDGKPGEMIGGLACLSGYLNEVRQKEKNTLYLIAGDMVQGSMIDTEFKGVSTMELMNYLAPDAATIGNHELNYGLYHLLFLDRLANFPIVVSNLYFKDFNKRLLLPYKILHVDGFDILIIGIITDIVTRQLKMDKDIGDFLAIHDAKEEIGRICNTYKDDDIDLTIVLTHIGIEEDRELAASLDPKWGVDMFIGGHSHTIMEQPEKINDILIVQAGVGTDQVGRFDIVVDDDTNSIVEWEWDLLEINEDLAEPDQKLQAYIDSFQDAVDRKYNTIITSLAKKLTNPVRYTETLLGNLYVDILLENSKADIAFLLSPAMRTPEMGPLVTYQDFLDSFPYDQALFKVLIPGRYIKPMLTKAYSTENVNRTFCHVSKGFHVVFDRKAKQIEELSFNGEPIDEARVYSICLHGFLYENCDSIFGFKMEELYAKGSEQISTSTQQILEEYLRNNQNLSAELEGRVLLLNHTPRASYENF